MYSSSCTLLDSRAGTEERQYVTEVILRFGEGRLPNVPDNTSLRVLLSTVLNCSPMRITRCVNQTSVLTHRWICAQASRRNSRAATRSRAGATAAPPRRSPRLCGNQISGAPRHRRDVLSVAASARWRGDSTPSTRHCPRGHVGSMAFQPNSLVDFHTGPRPSSGSGRSSARSTGASGTTARSSRRASAARTTCPRRSPSSTPPPRRRRPPVAARRPRSARARARGRRPQTLRRR